MLGMRQASTLPEGRHVVLKGEYIDQSPRSGGKTMGKSRSPTNVFRETGRGGEHRDDRAGDNKSYTAEDQIISLKYRDLTRGISEK